MMASSRQNLPDAGWNFDNNYARLLEAFYVRLNPVPGKKAGDQATFGGLMGHSTIISVNNAAGDNPFIRRGGLIPAPIHSLRN